MSASPESYDELLRRKVTFNHACGFDVDPSQISDVLLPHQRDLTRWAVAGGRRALFASFGIGKSVVQLEALRLIVEHADGRALVVLPQDVRHDFARDAAMLGHEEPRFVRRDTEVHGDGLHLTNYESIRDGRLDPTRFRAISLDEASVLRSYGSKTFQTFMAGHVGIPYRFVATATPDPNRHKELIHYAAYLGIMDSSAALTRFFQRDSAKAGNLTLLPHREREFWLWCNTWAAFVRRPSDLCHHDAHGTTGACRCDDGYDLPELDMHWHEVAVDHLDGVHVEPDGQGRLFKGGNLGVSDAAREKRDTLPARIAKTAELVAEHPDEHVILWHNLEAERHALRAAIDDLTEVYGSLDPDAREERTVGFAEGRYRRLSSKPEISGSGCNFQYHCAWAIFVGLGFSFNDFIQAIHRIQRFQQSRRVRIDGVYGESEREVLRLLLEKWGRYEEQAETMSDVLREFGLNADAIRDELIRTIGVERVEASGDGWLVARNDTVAETATMDTDSVGLVVTSIPFGNQYSYVNAVEDFGYSEDNAAFWRQMDHLTPNLLRVLQPGRIAAVHVKDRIRFASVTGAGVPTVEPFHAEAIGHFTRHGFDYLGMRTVVTDVVRENNQTYRLTYGELCKDATKMGSGMPEYILLFHKPQSDRTKGYADEPVTKSREDYSLARWQVDAHAFWRVDGNRPLSSDELAALKPEQMSRLFTEQTLRQVYDYESHVKVGEALAKRDRLPKTFLSLAPGSWHPDVWHDVNRLNTLNTAQSQAMRELHTCPFPLQIPERLIRLYSNPGDLVYDPFGGLMSTVLMAMRLGRPGRATELNPSSFTDGVGYLEAEERKRALPTLFDLVDIESQAAS